MSLFLLLVILVFLLSVSYLLSRGDVLNPAFLFALSFFICAAFAFSNARVWHYDASTNVVLLVSGGVGLFVIVAWLCRPKGRGDHVFDVVSTSWRLPIGRFALIVFLAFQIGVLLWSLKSLSAMYPASSPLESISLYDQANKFSAEGALDFPRMLSLLRRLASGVGYYVCYLLGQETALGREGRCRLLLTLNLLAAMLESMTAGGRNTAVSFLVYFFVAYLLVRRQWTGSRGAVPVRAFVAALIGFAIVIGVFQMSLVLMGRSSGTSYWNYICMYLGAEIPNLDAFISQPHQTPPLPGYMTFYTSYRWLGSSFGYSGYVYPMDLPFRYANGVLMGNVYTTFYAFIYDFGLVGVLFLVPLMAAVAQWFYGKAVRFEAGRHSAIWVILYCLVANTLVMSFFSNKFYEAFLTIGIATQVILLLFVHFCYLLALRVSWRESCPTHLTAPAVALGD